MRKFKVIVDSTSDLWTDIRNRYDIDYVQMGISVDDKEYPADLDFKAYSIKELYDWLRAGKRIYTSQVTNDEYKRVFLKYIEQGMDILYIACSSALSASYNASLMVRDEILKDHPEAKIVCYDSLLACLGQGSMAVKASIMQSEGKSLEEVSQWLLDNRKRFNQFATVEKLEYLKRAGRVKAGKAFFGDLFGVKPILINDVRGMNYAAFKAKGKVPSIKELARLAYEAMDGNYDQTIFLGHADDEKAVNMLKNEVLALVPNAKFEIGYIGPIIGATTGPGTLAIYVFGKEVTIKGE